MANPTHLELLRRGVEVWNEKRPENPDLAEADLVHANLSGANLSDAKLRGANLQRARLHYADLSKANLHAAILADAEMWNADLTDTDLTITAMHRATLTGAYGIRCSPNFGLLSLTPLNPRRSSSAPDRQSFDA